MAVKVKVVGTSQVVHDGKVYTDGDVFDAPGVDVDSWVARGYVERVAKEKSEAKAEESSANKAQDVAANKAASPRSSK